jgi:hypothetical protein
VALDRARADEKLRSDLGVRSAVARSRAICRSSAVGSSRVSTVRLRIFSPVASSSPPPAFGSSRFSSIAAAWPH